MKLKYYPTLTKAFELMLADNVASDVYIKKIREKVSEESLEPVGMFDRAEFELAELTPGALEMLCCGEEGEVEVSIDASEAVAYLFDLISI